MDCGRDIKDMLEDNELKAQIKIKKERIYQLNNYAIQRYLILCQRLYDKGIISNPSVFNYMDFFEYLYDNYNKDCKQLLGNSSKMQRNTLYLEYLLSKMPNTYFKRLIHIYHDIVECEEMLDLCNEFTSKPNKVEIEIRVRYCFTKGFSCKSTIDLDNHSMRYLVQTREKSLNKYYLRALENRVQSEGVILDSKEEDEKYFDLILSGDIKGNTLYAQKVTEYLTSLNYDLTKEELFFDIKEEVLKEIKRLKPVYMNKSGIYTVVKEKPLSFPSYVGTFIKDYTNEPLSVINCLNGYNGEFMSEEEVNKRGYFAKGFPVVLYKDQKKKAKYYPMFTIYTKYNLEYPLNPRSTFTHKKINPRVVKFEDKKEQEYCDELRALYRCNVANKVSKENYLREVKKELVRELTEEQKLEVKQKLAAVLEYKYEL